MLKISVPYGCSYNRVMDALESMGDRLEELRPRARYCFGQRITSDYIDVTLKPQYARPREVYVSADNVNDDSVSICIWHGADISSPNVENIITRMLKRIAKVKSHSLLMEAQCEMQRLGLSATVKISNGGKLLGFCEKSGRVIHLSSILMFYPAELRRALICHELTHLTVSGHGEDFHQLCGQYVGSDYPRIRKLLKTYRCPVLQ